MSESISTKPRQRDISKNILNSKVHNLQRQINNIETRNEDDKLSIRVTMYTLTIM